MASISKCPRCYSELWIGDTSHTQRLLRCPMCSGVFGIQEILANCTPAPPAALVVDDSPELELVVTPTHGHSSAFEQGLGTMTPASNLPTAPEGAELDITGSAAEGAPQIDSDVGDALPPNNADANPVATDSGYQGYAGSYAPAAYEATPAYEAPAEPTYAPDYGGEQSDAEQAYTTTPARRPAPPPPGSAIRTLIGIVLGGVVGLTIGYILLVNIGDRMGQNKDFLKLKPSIPWLFPWRDRTSLSKSEEPVMEIEAETIVFEPLSTEPVPLKRTPDPEPEPSPPEAAEPETPEPEQPAVVAASATTRKARPTILSDRLGPRRIAPVSLAQMNDATVAVVRVLGCEHCQSKGYTETTEVVSRTDAEGNVTQEKVPTRVVCEACGGKPSGRITLPTYNKLCQLAETVTFVEVPPDEPSLLERRVLIGNVVARAAFDRTNTETIGRLAKEKLANQQREDDGILLAGTVTESVAVGPLFRTTLVLLGTPKTVQVFSRNQKALELLPRAHYAMLGIVIDDPAENLNGYQGDAQQVVWAGLPVPLDAE